MKKIPILVVIATILLSGDVHRYRKNNLVLEDIPEIPASIEARLRPYQSVRFSVFADWLPKEQGILMKTRFGETRQIHLIELPKGMRRQLTFFGEPIAECTVCPDSRQSIFLFTKDSAGNELHQIYKYDYVSGNYELLSDGESKFNSVVWSRKGNKFAFRSTMRNRRDYDIYLGDVSGEKSFRLILQEGGYWYPVQFSPDDRQLLVKKYVSSNESYYYILDLHSKKITQIDPEAGRVAYGTARWSPDREGIYIVSDKFGDFKQLMYYSLQSREFEILTKQIAWDVGEVEIAPSGNVLAFISNEDGYCRLYLMDIKSRRLGRVSLPDGQIYHLQFKPDGDELAFSLITTTAPTDIYTLNLSSRTFLRWTHSEIGGLDTTQFVSPVLIQYETFDSIDGHPRSIPAFYYKPKSIESPLPVLIDVHGGPAVQADAYFSYLRQFLLNELGIAIITPNVRGSSGYGKEFMMLDDGYKREDAVKDIGTLLEWIEGQPQLDAQRVGIWGGSYGGYMVLAAMIHYGDRLRCGIDEYGISNFVTFLQNTGKYRQNVRRTEYGDERDPKMREFLNRISPLTNARKIRKPMFIVQGLHDPRVPVSEAEQIVAAVRKNDSEVWYLLAEDEGHGLSKKSNRSFFQQALALFLEKFLIKKN